MAFNDVITFSDVNLNDGLRDVPYNQCISYTWEFSNFIFTWVGYPRIKSRISLSGVQETIMNKAPPKLEKNEYVAEATT